MSKLATTTEADLTTAVQLILNRARKMATSRAVFMHPTEKGFVVDTEVYSKLFMRTVADFPRTLIGCYDSSCDPAWLMSDLRNTNGSAKSTKTTKRKAT